MPLSTPTFMPFDAKIPERQIRVTAATITVMDGERYILDIDLLVNGNAVIHETFVAPCLMDLSYELETRYGFDPLDAALIVNNAMGAERGN